MLALLALFGPKQGLRIPLVGRLTLGRGADADLQLVDGKVSREHCRIDATGARAMTPGFSPPEQYGTARTDARTDIYSLGATLYVALTGRIPEDGLARATSNAYLTEVRQQNPLVSADLAAVVEKALALQPEDRWQTALDFKDAL